MLPPIIGLLGRARSGKDTVARILLEMTHGSPYAVVRLAAPIKEAARALFDFDDSQIEGDRKEVVDPRWGIAPRRVFQALTDDMMKSMGEDHFTRLLYAKYDAGAFGPRIIIPDIRYAHDVDEIRRRGGAVLKVQRRDLPMRYACEDHLDVMDADVVLYNDGSLDDLRAAVARALKDVRRSALSP
jgi:hypothetical protein